jgi:hypothetical protein
MDETAALAIDDIVRAIVTTDGRLVLLRLSVGEMGIDLAFPIAKAEKLVCILTQAVEYSAHRQTSP